MNHYGWDFFLQYLVFTHKNIKENLCEHNEKYIRVNRYMHAYLTLHDIERSLQ